ncbi:MAG: inorganic diphosphatase [Candidatus Levybacteria bacterium]|nr:inorganic diphosphatase [Candidatus Levybacteria bacterium]
MQKLPVGKNPQNGEINVLIEISKNSNIKYELDKDSGFMFVDRFLHTAMNYPCNYGFIPNTHAEDGDPVDVLVMSEYAVVPGVVIPSLVIGVLEMEDEAGIDAKLLAVPSKKIDPMYGSFTDIGDVPEAIKNKIKHFFENYKTLEPDKWVKVKEWHGREKALEAVKNGMK